MMPGQRIAAPYAPGMKNESGRPCRKKKKDVPPPVIWDETSLSRKTAPEKSGRRILQCWISHKKALNPWIKRPCFVIYYTCFRLICQGSSALYAAESGRFLSWFVGNILSFKLSVYGTAHLLRLLQRKLQINPFF